MPQTEKRLSGRQHSKEFERTLEQIVDEITCKVILRQPKDIYAFCADLLDQKVKERNVQLNKDCERPSFLQNHRQLRQMEMARIKPHNPSETEQLGDKNQDNQIQENVDHSQVESKEISFNDSYFNDSVSGDDQTQHNQYGEGAKPKIRSTMHGTTQTHTAIGRLSHDGLTSIASEGIVSGHQALDSRSVKPIAGCRPPDVTMPSFKPPGDRKPVSVLRAHNLKVTQAVVVETYIITSSLDKVIKIWNLSDGVLLMTYSCAKPVTALVCLEGHGKTWILAAMVDGKTVALRIRYGDKISLKLKAVFPMHIPNPILAMALSQNYRYLATGSCYEMTQISLSKEVYRTVRGAIKIWDLVTIVEFLLDATDSYHEVASQGLKTWKQLATVTALNGGNRLSSYHRLSTYKESDTETHFGIRGLAYTPDSTKLVVGFGTPEPSCTRATNMFVVVDAVTLATLWVQTSECHDVLSVGFSVICGDGSTRNPWQMLLATSRGLHKMDVTVKASESTDKPDELSIRTAWALEHDILHCDAEFSPDGTLVCSANGRTVVVYEAGTGANVASYKGHADTVVHVKFTPCGHFLVSAAVNGDVCVWRAPSKVQDVPHISLHPNLNVEFYSNEPR